MKDERWGALTKTLAVMCDRMQAENSPVARAIVKSHNGTKALILVAIGNEAVEEVKEVTHTLVDSEVENLAGTVAKA